MGHYKVRYSVGRSNAYVYPKSVAGVVWTSVVYHATDRVMIGETDMDVKADRKNVVALTPAQARKLVEEYRAGYPKPKKLPWLSTSARQAQ